VFSSRAGAGYKSKYSNGQIKKQVYMLIHEHDVWENISAGKRYLERCKNACMR
jgi:hypothetical protein